MRKITDKMFNYVDNKLALNGAAQNAIANKDARSLFIYASESCVGILEAGGNNKGPLVEELQKTVDGKASREPFCMGAVQTWLAYVERKLGVVSPIASSEHCMTTWRDTPKAQRVKTLPLAGAIVIWQHWKANKPTEKGHTGVETEVLQGNKKMETVEANTGDESMRDGDGVHIRTRSMIKDGSMRVVGFLKPFN